MRKALLLPALVAQGLFLLQSVSGQPKEGGLLLHYAFEPGDVSHVAANPEGDCVVRDVSGKGHHGWILGGSLARTGRNAALSLAGGSSNAVICVGSRTLHPSGPASQITMMGWFRWETEPPPGGGSLLLNSGTASVRVGTRASYGLCTAGGWLEATGHRNGGTIDLPAGRWHHVAVTYDSRSHVMVAYVNGKLDRDEEFVERTDYDLAPSRKAREGNLIVGGSWFEGMLDNIRIYDRVLSRQEVRAVYAAEKRVVTGGDYREADGN